MEGGNYCGVGMEKNRTVLAHNVSNKYFFHLQGRRSRALAQHFFTGIMPRQSQPALHIGTNIRAGKTILAGIISISNKTQENTVLR